MQWKEISLHLINNIPFQFLFKNTPSFLFLLQHLLTLAFNVSFSYPLIWRLDKNFLIIQSFNYNPLHNLLVTSSFDNFAVTYDLCFARNMMLVIAIWLSSLTSIILAGSVLIFPFYLFIYFNIRIVSWSRSKTFYRLLRSVPSVWLHDIAGRNDV